MKSISDMVQTAKEALGKSPDGVEATQCVECRAAVGDQYFSVFGNITWQKDTGLIGGNLVRVDVGGKEFLAVTRPGIICPKCLFDVLFSGVDSPALST
tara:strand:+ start:251 stop:544 length:294 start_codon:yes stop_codon:yes gene_type:complete